MCKFGMIQVLISIVETKSIKTMKLVKWVMSLRNLNILKWYSSCFCCFFISLTMAIFFQKKEKKSNIRKNNYKMKNTQPTNNNFKNVK